MSCQFDNRVLVELTQEQKQTALEACPTILEVPPMLLHPNFLDSLWAKRDSAKAYSLYSFEETIEKTAAIAPENQLMVLPVTPAPAQAYPNSLFANSLFLNISVSKRIPVNVLLHCTQEGGGTPPDPREYLKQQEISIEFLKKTIAELALHCNKLFDVYKQSLSAAPSNATNSQSSLDEDVQKRRAQLIEETDARRYTIQKFEAACNYAGYIYRSIETLQSTKMKIEDDLRSAENPPKKVGERAIQKWYEALKRKAGEVVTFLKGEESLEEMKKRLNQELVGVKSELSAKQAVKPEALNDLVAYASALPLDYTGDKDLMDTYSFVMNKVSNTTGMRYDPTKSPSRGARAKTSKDLAGERTALLAACHTAGTHYTTTETAAAPRINTFVQDLYEDYKTSVLHSYVQESFTNEETRQFKYSALKCAIEFPRVYSGHIEQEPCESSAVHTTTYKPPTESQFLVPAFQTFVDVMIRNRQGNPRSLYEIVNGAVSETNSAELRLPAATIQTPSASPPPPQPNPVTVYAWRRNPVNGMYSFRPTTQIVWEDPQALDTPLARTAEILGVETADLVVYLDKQLQENGPDLVHVDDATLVPVSTALEGHPFAETGAELGVDPEFLRARVQEILRSSASAQQSQSTISTPQGVFVAAEDPTDPSTNANGTPLERTARILGVDPRALAAYLRRHSAPGDPALLEVAGDLLVPLQTRADRNPFGSIAARLGLDPRDLGAQVQKQLASDPEVVQTQEATWVPLQIGDTRDPLGFVALQLGVDSHTLGSQIQAKLASADPGVVQTSDATWVPLAAAGPVAEGLGIDPATLSARAAQEAVAPSSGTLRLEDAAFVPVANLRT